MRINRISCQVKEYLEYKRSLGFKLKADEIVLKGFVQYTLEKGYDGSLCKDIVLDWIASGVNSDKTMGRKQWTEQGIDVNKNLYILSTYLGHVRPQDTYWYISSTPEIMKLSCLKYEEMFGGDFDEE